MSNNDMGNVTMDRRPKFTVMLDIESLDVGPRSVVTQIGLFATDSDDVENIIIDSQFEIPIQPQLDAGRTISASTFLWWMRQPEHARAHMQLCDSDDVEEFRAIMRDVLRKMARCVNDSSAYELVAKGPQFDVVNLETLLNDAGLVSPWKYSKVVDLRTLMHEAGLTDNLPVEHSALADATRQMFLLNEARAILRRNRL